MDRRKFIRNVSVGTVASLGTVASTSSFAMGCTNEETEENRKGRQFLLSIDEPIVQTVSGKIRGYQLDGIYTFHGIKYADAKRFQMPTPVKPWDGVRDALSFGYICPIMDHSRPTNQVLNSHRFWPEHEDCQYLNVWTNSLDRSAKKPVMLWFHGGTFVAGSSIEIAAYDGDNMAKYHDVVFITLNHRLNILGHLDMSAYGSKYENSVHAGIVDLIEALKWIRDNIEGFGGDPNNVTIFGQSGGGRKCQTLLQAPAAAGLFHKVILQSGVSPWNPLSSEHHKKLISLMLSELNIPEREFETLERVPYPVLTRAYYRARLKLNELTGEEVDPSRGQEFMPVKNGWFLGAPPHHAFSDYARTVPVMMGSVICENGNTPPIPNRNSLTAEKKREFIKEKFGEDTDKLIELFNKAYPGKNELLLLDFDTNYRGNLLPWAERKVNESKPGVPLYVFMFAVEFDYYGGKGAWHCSDIPFTRHNAEKIPVNHMDEMDKIENEMSEAWASFARTGNPNHSGLPVKWPEYDLTNKGVMVFDKKSEVRFNHEKELVDLHKKALSQQQSTSRSARRFADLGDEKWIY